jgi:hypothetical protein
MQLNQPYPVRTSSSILLQLVALDPMHSVILKNTLALKAGNAVPSAQHSVFQKWQENF